MNKALVLVLLMFVWPFSSAKTFHMKASSAVPAATGTVKVQPHTDNGNVKLDIKVAGLAKPSNLTPPADLYIVWIVPNGKTAVKKGAIAVDKNLKGELNVVTLSKNFDVFITPEQSPAVTAPSGAKVLETHVNVD